MGVLNATPDSFSDGGRFYAPAAAVAHGVALAREGAQIVDVGGESTRPGAEPVEEREEVRRVVPVIEGLAAALPAVAREGGTGEVTISVDTYKSAVAREAVQAGARLVNDVSALRADPEMAQVVAESGTDCCLSHILGAPHASHPDPRYEDVVDEVKAFLEERVRFAVGRGIAEERLLIDPGIGFGKTPAHNLELLRRLDELVAIGPPVLVGTSRKSFLGRIVAEAAGLPEPLGVGERLPGTIATNVLAYERGASVFRVHDVAPVRDALAVAAATLAAHE
jgi:dihydropteroate synthase